MKEILKGVLLTEDMVDEIKEMAKQDRRSFTRQVQYLLEKVIENQKTAADGVVDEKRNDQ